VPVDNSRASSAYLFIDNADELAAAWLAAGADVHQPQTTEWGQHEVAVAAPRWQCDPLAHTVSRRLTVPPLR